MNKGVITIVSVLIVAILATCGYLCYAYSKKEFYCNTAGRMYQPFSTAESVCKKQIDNEKKYERCKTKFAKAKKAFLDGKCSEIKRDTVKVDDSTCKVTYSIKNNTYFSYSCNPHSKEITDKLRKMYGR